MRLYNSKFIILIFLILILILFCSCVDRNYNSSVQSNMPSELPNAGESTIIENGDNMSNDFHDSKENQIFVNKINNIPDNFIFGMDTSCVPSLEASGVKYFDENNIEKDVFQILMENGINCIRVRIWNNPYDNNGNGYGGGNCDIENAIEIAKRAAKYEMKLFIDFHYSDFWADPSKQQAPKEWNKMSVDDKSKALYSYTRESLLKLKDTGVEIALVQIGNETNNAFCGEYISKDNDWINISKLMSAGIKAVREYTPNALVAIHFTNPEKQGSYMYYSRMLEENNVDYDVFASSYYPLWHGTIDNLATSLSEVAKKYDKKILIAETSYPYTSKNTDFHNNTISENDRNNLKYGISLQGQAEYLRELIDTLVNNSTNVIGVCYWEGTWISIGTKSYENNLKLWEKFGSGWATSFSAEYDPDDAGKWYGGCAVENQAFFYENGKVTPVLSVFKKIS